jgi:hypothetical protein
MYHYHSLFLPTWLQLSNDSRLNTMIDVSTSRLAGERSKVPQSIVVMLFFLP